MTSGHTTRTLNAVSLVLAGVVALGVAAFAVITGSVLATAVLMAGAYGAVGWFLVESSNVRMPLGQRFIVFGVALGLLPIVIGAPALGAAGEMSRDVGLGVAVAGSCVVAFTAVIQLVRFGRSFQRDVGQPDVGTRETSHPGLMQQMRRVALLTTVSAPAFALLAWWVSAPIWLIGLIMAGGILSLISLRQLRESNRDLVP